MRVSTLVPIQETFHVDGIADLQVFNCLVYVAVLVAQVRLDGEGIGLAVVGNIEVQIVSFGTGTIIVVKVSNIFAVRILGSLNGESINNVV